MSLHTLGWGAPTMPTRAVRGALGHTGFGRSSSRSHSSYATHRRQHSATCALPSAGSVALLQAGGPRPRHVIERTSTRPTDTLSGVGERVPRGRKSRFDGQRAQGLQGLQRLQRVQSVRTGGKGGLVFVFVGECGSSSLSHTVYISVSRGGGAKW